MTQIVVADIGGTHARFAIATLEDGQVVSLEHHAKMKSSEHASLQIAWESYGEGLGRDLPRQAAIAVAGPTGGDVIYFTNSSWMVRPALLAEKLNLERYTLINDFVAVAHAVARMDEEMFRPICGPEGSVHQDGVISVVGPGTGLGVAHVLRAGEHYHVTETEGGHTDFAPLDPVEDKILAHLRNRHRRVSTERVTSGPALADIYHVLAELEHREAKLLDDAALWQLALSGSDSLSAAAFDRFCLCLGSVTGDIALAQGAKSVVMAGGLGLRISQRLPSSGFCERFVAKGRFQSLMEQIPVMQLLHEEPGLYGAAVAFAQQHGP